MLRLGRLGRPLLGAATQARGLCGATTARKAADLPRTYTLGSERVGALGMKCGMTQAWTEWGKLVPLTVVEVQDLQVTSTRTLAKDGFCALQLGGGWQKQKRLSFHQARPFEKHGLPLKRYLREFRVTEDAMLPIGTSITARHFVPGQYVDVQGVTKGKGFAGAMKRWGFKGQPATHGVSKYHRGVGSMGGAAGGLGKTGIWKGKKMPGKMGNKRRTSLGLLVWKVVPEHNLVFLKGSVPGGKGGTLRIKDTVHYTRGRFKTVKVRPSTPAHVCAIGTTPPRVEISAPRSLRPEVSASRISASHPLVHIICANDTHGTATRRRTRAP